MTGLTRRTTALLLTVGLALCAAVCAVWLVKRTFGEIGGNLDVGSVQRLQSQMNIAADSVRNRLTAASTLKIQDGTKPRADRPRSQATTIELRGIVWDEERPLAFLNEDVLSVGETIGVYRVELISHESVTLDNGRGEALVLDLYP